MSTLYRGSSMKRQKGPKRQTARKKKDFSAVRRIFFVAGSCLAKFSCLMIGLVVISLLFVYLYSCLLKSPYLLLDRIVVTGIEEEEKGELLESIGLQGDVSLLSIDLNEIKENIEKRPWIRTVDLEKRFPHTLILGVKKEKAWALVAADELYYMNRWGEVFTEAGETGELDYPIITGIGKDEIDGNERLVCAVEVLSLLEKEETPCSLNELSEIHVKKDGNVALYFSSLPLAINRRGSELSERIGDLRKLVKHLKDTGRIRMVKGINLNYQDAAVVSFRKG